MTFLNELEQTAPRLLLFGNVGLTTLAKKGKNLHANLNTAHTWRILEAIARQSI